MVSKTPIGPANCKPHVVGCCPKLSVYPPHRLPTSSAIASIPLGSRESSREEGVERHHMEAHTIQCYFFYFAAIFRATSQQPSKQLLGALLRGGDRILPYNRELRGRECAKRGQDGHEERMEA
jgi:hypothetical protein